MIFTTAGHLWLLYPESLLPSFHLRRKMFRTLLLIKVLCIIFPNKTSRTRNMTRIAICWKYNMLRHQVYFPNQTPDPHVLLVFPMLVSQHLKLKSLTKISVQKELLRNELKHPNCAVFTITPFSFVSYRFRLTSSWVLVR